MFSDSKIFIRVNNYQQFFLVLSASSLPPPCILPASHAVLCPRPPFANYHPTMSCVRALRSRIIIPCCPVFAPSVRELSSHAVLCSRPPFVNYNWPTFFLSLSQENITTFPRDSRVIPAWFPRYSLYVRLRTANDLGHEELPSEPFWAWAPR